jgi:hypothetical protein
MYQCSESAFGPSVFGPPGSACRFVSQRYGSKDPDSHPDPYTKQNVTDPQHCPEVPIDELKISVADP